ncbi:MAG TPA: TnsD family transposase [Leptolyngbyaceae cyanobacterium]
MIGFFPDPYPDELLYSVCARYSDRVHYRSREVLAQELFGSINASATVDLPNHLDHLIAVLPNGHHYTVDYLINRCTLFPFYKPFLSPERVNYLIQAMRGTGGNVHSLLGLRTIRSLNYLRFCPLCAIEDRKQYGEMYWHRLHQIPGVEVCSTHTVFLEISSTRSNINEFVSAEQEIQVTSPQSLNLLNSFHQKLLKIAQDTAWLLNQQSLVFELKSIQNRYLYLLAGQGLASYNGGKVHIQQLLEAFKNYYSPELLKLLQCEVDAQNEWNWLSRLVRPPKGSQHPLRYLLLMHFLGHTVEEFFKLPSEFKPFGEGPWFCLNPVCPHFQKLKIKECQIKYSKIESTPINIPSWVGIFGCECGFVYSIKDLHQNRSNRFRVSTVKSYGPLWEEALRKLWEDSSVTLTKIGHQLGVSRCTVKEHAIRLGLSFPRQGPSKPTQLKAEQLSCSVKEQVDAPKKFEIYRNEWLSVLEQNPNADRTSLRNQSSRVYLWLRKRDSEWLEAHLPPPRRNNGSPHADWKSRDIQLAEAVRNSAVRLKEADGRPIKITIRAIGRDINQLALIQYHLNKLPLTAKALEEVVETWEVYTIRRICWAAECFRREKVYPSQRELKERAGITGIAYNRLAAIPQVQKALHEALKSLEP